MLRPTGRPLTVCLIAALLTFASLCGPAWARGDFYRFGDFHDDLSEAVIVARVRLESRTMVSTRPAAPREPWRPALGEAPFCGYLYKAKVIESFKGDLKEVEFFVPHENDFSGFDHDYFVLIFKRKPSYPTINEAEWGLTFLDEDIRQVNCLLSQEYFVGNLTQTMFSFDPLASSQLGGEWLDPPDREALGWCTYEKAVAAPGEPRVYYDREVQGRQNSYGLQSWRRLKATEPAFFRRDSLATNSYPVRSWSEFTKIVRQNVGDGPYLQC